MQMIELSSDQTISLALVLTLLIVTRARDMLDPSGISMAVIVGLVVSLMGHLSLIHI